MDKFVPLVRALIPVIFMGLAALGINVSEDVKQVVVENLEAILIAGGALSAVFPSLVAAVKFKGDAK